MSLPANIAQCHHRKINGVRCGSPALSAHSHCYFHHELRQRSARYRATNSSQPLQLPPLEDANSIQFAIMQVVDAILRGQIDNKRAALVLYALQTASANLKRTDLEPYWPKLADVAGPQAEAEAVARGLMQPRRKGPKLSRRERSRQANAAHNVPRIPPESVRREAISEAKALIREHLGELRAANAIAGKNGSGNSSQ